MESDFRKYGKSFGQNFPQSPEEMVNPRNILFRTRIQSASPKERIKLAKEFAAESQKLRQTGLSRGENQPSLTVPNAPGTGDNPYYQEPVIQGNRDPRINRTGIGMGGTIPFPWNVSDKGTPATPQGVSPVAIQSNDMNAVVPERTVTPVVAPIAKPVVRRDVAKVAASPEANSFYPDMSVPRTNLRQKAATVDPFNIFGNRNGYNPLTGP